MKRREQLPFFKKISYKFDVDKILKDFELIKNKNDDLTIEGGYGDVVGSASPKLQKAFGIGEYTEYVDGMIKGEYKQVGITQYNSELKNKKYKVKINKNKPDERHYNTLRPELKGSYIEEVMKTFKGEVTRARIAILKPSASIKPHIDYNTNYSVRYHIPLITNKDCGFNIVDKKGNKEEIHMATGECWFLNQGFKHSAWNKGNNERWHLILSVIGQEDLYE